MLRPLATVALLVPLMAAAQAGAEADPAADPAKAAAASVKTDRLNVLGSVKRVAITQFRVEFAVENSAKATSSGTGGWTASSSQVKLTGVDDEVRQAIADKLYERLVQELAATGLEVIPYATVRETEGYKSIGPVLRTSREPLDMQTGKSVFIGAKGMPWYFSNDDRHVGLSTALGAFSTTQPQNLEPQIAKALDAAVLRVTMLVAFAEQSTGGGLFRSGSSITTKARLAFLPQGSQYVIVAPEGRTRVYLDQPLLMAADAITIKDATSDTDKAVQAVANVITGLLAKGGRMEREYHAVTTPESYSSAVTNSGTALQTAMVAAMRPALTVKPPVAAAAAAPSPEAAATPAPATAAPASAPAAPAPSQ